MVPVLVFAFVLLRVLPALRGVVPESTERPARRVGEDDVRAMSLLSS